MIKIVEITSQFFYFQFIKFIRVRKLIKSELNVFIVFNY